MKGAFHMENPKKFAEVAMFPGNPHWEDAVKRENDLYSRGSKEIRSEFVQETIPESFTLTVTAA